MNGSLTGALALSLLTLSLALPAAAESSFGGSFDGDTTAPQGGQTGVLPPPLPQGGTVTDGFQGTGSFEPGGAQTGGVVLPPPPPPNFGPSDVVIAPTPPAPPAPPQTPTVQPQPPPQPPVNPNDQASQLAAFETRDFGVQPVQQLRQGEFHAPTPTAIPGGQLLTTQNLAKAINNGTQILLIDVLGGQYSLPNAYPAGVMAQGGDFNDRVQQQTVQWLGQVTGGQKNVPIVVYCSDPMCWLSYNAALRAIAAGYTNVYWYRGGLQAWQMAGLPTNPARY